MGKPSGIVVKWDKRAIARLGIKGLEPMLVEAGKALQKKVVKNLSTPTSTFGPSKPGEFPHADTGRLRQSIFRTVAPGPMILGVQSSEVRIGTNLRYGLHHEYLTGRSFLRRTLQESMPALKAFFRGARLERS
jgi:hypothetical protein